jgi:hypothetical protein
MKSFERQIKWMVLATLLCGATLRAQEQPSEPSRPKPAGQAIIFDSNQNPDSSIDPDAIRPDTSPLTGLQYAGLGSPEFRHSYWVPGVQVADTAQSGYGGGGWTDTVFLAGNVSLLEAWSHSRLAVNYSGGGYFSTNNQGNGTYQQLGFSQSFDWERWKLEFFDQFAYLPTTQFGFGGLSGIGLPGIGGSLGQGGPGIGNTYIPDQGVLVSTGPRFSNSFATQATFTVSPRSSITLNGSYGFLKFVDPGNIDNDDIIGSVGYNYVLSKKDTIGVLYRFTGYHFSGVPQAIGDHAFNLAYGRRITGRMALTLSAGPEITRFRIPVNNSRQRTGVSVGASLTYGFANGGVALYYSHGTNGGAGVLAGASGDQLNLSATRRVTRIWTAHGNLGYSRIEGFTPIIVTPKTTATPGYNSFFAGAGLERPLGRNANVAFGYTAYISNTNSGVCALCTGGTSVEHQFAIGFQWHARPFVLR